MVKHLRRWIGRKTTLKIGEQTLAGKVVQYSLTAGYFKHSHFNNHYAFITDEGQVLRIGGKNSNYDRVRSFDHHTLEMDLSTYTGNWAYAVSPHRRQEIA